MGKNTILGVLAANIGLAARGALRRNDNDTVSIYRSDQWRKDSALILRESFLDACALLKPGTFLELGAHGAEASIQFVARTGGRAIAYEANPFTYESVTIHAVSAGVEVINMGVGATSGNLEMQIPLLGDAQSITPVQASFLRRTEEVSYQTVSVEMTTLDDISSEVDISASVIVWVDVEGLALEVLSGGLSLLGSDKCLMVMVEVEVINLWEKQAGALAVDNLLNTQGFIPVMRDAEYEFQFNVVYVKETLVGDLEHIISGFWSDLASICFRDPRTRTGRFIAGLDLKGRFSRMTSRMFLTD